VEGADPPPNARLRRLLALASIVVFVDTMFYAAITPLLPTLADEHGLSKAEAGVLAGSYAAGTLVGALPGGWLAARAGVRATVLLGLGLMTGASVVFALADDIVVLDAARFVQGVGGAASWAGALGWLIGAAPRERRGELIGSAVAAAIGGALFGPVLGAAAEGIGRAPVFGAVAAAGVALSVWTLLTPGAAPGRPPSRRVLGAALRDRRVMSGMWLTAAPALAFGAISVLAPLRMDELGASAAIIAGAFLVAAAFEATVSPLAGRLSDRRGRRAPLLAGLAGTAATLALMPWPATTGLLTAVIVVAGAATGTLWAPAMAMLSDGAEAVGVELGFAFALANLAWAGGQTAGSAGGARLAEAVGDRVPYLLLAALLAATFAALVKRE
jgi:MFS family permease